jgi:hypothetical protein
MCQFSYFVGKMTHRPDARRQIEPPSEFVKIFNYEIADFRKSGVKNRKSSQIRSPNQKGPWGVIWWKKQMSKISCQGTFNSFLRRSVSYYPIMPNSVQSKFPRNSAAFRYTEFRIIPRNFRQFRMAYGIYGSNKNVRNSVLTEFRGHPTWKRKILCFLLKICFLWRIGFRTHMKAIRGNI